MYCAIHIHLINYFTYNKRGNFGNLRSFFSEPLRGERKTKMKKCPHVLYVKQLSKGVSNFYTTITSFSGILAGSFRNTPYRLI